MADKAAWGAMQLSVGGNSFQGGTGCKMCRVPEFEGALCKTGCQAKGRAGRTAVTDKRTALRRLEETCVDGTSPWAAEGGKGCSSCITLPAQIQLV